MRDAALLNVSASFLYFVRFTPPSLSSYLRPLILSLYSEVLDELNETDMMGGAGKGKQLLNYIILIGQLTPRHQHLTRPPFHCQCLSFLWSTTAVTILSI